MSSNILDRISFWLLFAVIVLLPIFFLPFTRIPVDISKGLLLVSGLTISVIFWAMARFRDGRINLPRSLVLLSAFTVVLVTLVSALFSSALEVSLFGTMLDIGSFYFILGAFLLMLSASIVLRDIKNVRIVLFGLILSSAVLLLFQVSRLFFPDFLSFQVLGGKADNILGSWNAFGLFTGFFAVMSLFIVEFFSISKGIKWFFGILIALSIILSAAVNFSLTWILLGIFALIIFVYKISFFYGKKQLSVEGLEKDRGETHFPVFPFVVVIVCLLFFMSGQFIGGFLPSRLGLSNIEVGPSFSATLSVAKGAFIKDPILGLGPNRFSEAWAMYKPREINSTQFWDTSFNFGSGLLPTFVASTGMLGILSWLAFFIMFLVAGVKSLFKSIKNNINWEMVVFFVMALYLFISSFFYSTGGVILLLAFAFTGIFIGLSSSRQDGEIEFSFLNDPRKSFFSILSLIVLIIVSLATLFKYAEKLASISYLGKTLSASTIQTAEDSITRAISLHQNDLYFRVYAQVYLTKAQSIISKGESLSEVDKSDLQKSIDRAVSGAQLAVAYDNTNYLNYNSLGTVYDALRLIGVKDVGEKEIEAYQKASALNPLNPGVKLTLARVFSALGKTQESKDFAKESLVLKPDYIEALIILSQIEKKGGNNTAAISYAERALAFIPDNKDLSDYVNSLKNGSSVAVPPLVVPSDSKDTKKKNSN